MAWHWRRGTRGQAQGPASVLGGGRAGGGLESRFRKLGPRSVPCPLRHTCELPPVLFCLNEPGQILLLVIKPVTLMAPVPGAAGGSRPPRKWGWTGCYLKTVRRRSRDRLGPWQPTAAEAGLRSLEQPLRARLRGVGGPQPWDNTTEREGGVLRGCTTAFKHTKGKEERT